MRFPRAFLSDDERVVAETRPHAAALAGPGVAAATAAVGGLALGALLTPGAGDDLLDVAVGVLAIALTARWAWRYLCWRAERVVVTDQRIMRASGVLTRRVASLPLRGIHDLSCRRGVVGRLLGYGDLIVAVPGREEPHTFGRLARPHEVYRAVSSLLGAHRRSDVDERRAWANPGNVRSWEDADTGELPRVVV